MAHGFAKWHTQKTEEDRGRSRKIEEDRGRSRKIEENRGKSRRSRKIEEDRGRPRKIEEDRGKDRGKDRGRSRKRSRKTEEDRGKQKKIEEDRGKSRKIEEFDFRKLGVFLATLGFRGILFFGGDVRVLEMLGFDEWISRGTLSIFRFMPTLCLLPLLKVSFFRQNRQDAKSRHILEEKVAKQLWTDNCPWDWCKCFRIFLSCCRSMWLAGPAHSKKQGCLPPAPPLQEICYFSALARPNSQILTSATAYWKGDDLALVLPLRRFPWVET